MTNLPPRGPQGMPGAYTKRLCHDETHVYLVGAAYCTCGGQINLPPLMMGWFGTGYAPPGYKPAAPKVDEDVPLSRLKAAVDAKALYLSADGLRAYRDDRGNPEVAFWNAELGRFDSWWACTELANDAIKLDSEEHL